MRYSSYKDFDIAVKSQWLADTGKWTLEVTIMRESDPNKTAMSRTFQTDEQFSSEDDAVAASVEYAKKIIDGQVDGATVEDL